MKVTYQPPPFNTSHRSYLPPAPSESEYLFAMFNAGLSTTYGDTQPPAELYLEKELTNPHSFAKRHERWKAYQAYKKTLLAEMVTEGAEASLWSHERASKGRCDIQVERALGAREEGQGGNEAIVRKPEAGEEGKEKVQERHEDKAASDGYGFCRMQSTKLSRRKSVLERYL